MFTTEQIKQAHKKVKSGADFPAYISELKQLGVTCYETYVDDGHTNYFGSNNYKTSSPATYQHLPVAELPDAAGFQADLKVHQQGKTDYTTFCNDCARSGIEKWTVNIGAMTCTYHDKAGYAVLIEMIPG